MNPCIECGTNCCLAQMEGKECKAMNYEARPHGEWIVQRLQNGFDDVYCPFCKARPTRSEYGYYLRDNFCHECGADMRPKEGAVE